MEFQQLEMFVAMVEERSVSRAADRVCRTAPAVSVALRKLEDEMGTPLFDRTERHNHRLTESGKLLYSHATRILAMRNEASAVVKGLARGQRQNLRLGTHESTSLYVLPSLIHAFGEAHPGVKTEVVSGSSQRLLTALANRTIEVALMGDVPDEPQLERHFIMRDELVLITSPKHRLSGAMHIHVRDLAGEFLIVQGTKSLLRERLVQALQESDTPFNVCVENIAIEAIKRMVAEDLGIGFVPLMCVREEADRGKLTTIKVEGINREWDLWLVRRKDHLLSEAARAFISASLNTEKSFAHEERVRSNSRQPIAIQPRRVVHC
jgi:DNA-binding transcriptional LysR family regulator